MAQKIRVFWFFFSTRNCFLLSPFPLSRKRTPMRKRLLIAIPATALLAILAAWLLLRHPRDDVAAATQLMARRDMKGASLYLRDAVRAQPKNPDAAFLLGRVDLALGNPTAAQLEFERARANGFDKTAIILPLGQAYLQQRHATELLHDFDPNAVPPDAKATTFSLRAAAEMFLHDPDAASAASAAAESLAPDSPYVLLTASRLALLRGDQAGAATRIAKILAPDAKPDDETRADALLLRGDLAMRHNEPASALADARAVIASNPARIDAVLLEARALAATGAEKAARAEVDTVLRHVPKDISANYLRVILAIHANDYAAADASLLQIGPAISGLPRGFYFLAVTKLALHQLSEAEEAATQFLAQSPDDVPGLKLMAFIDLARQHADRALALLQNSALATHADADTFDLRGRALAMTGDLKGARENLAKAASLHPADPSILNRLATVEMDLGNIQAGEADLKHSLQLAPKQDRTGAAIVEADLTRFDLAAARQDLDALRASLGDVQAVGLLDAQIKLATLDADGAESELLAIRKRFPDSRAAVLFLVRIYRMHGKTEQSTALLEAALAKHPADVEFLDLVLPALAAEHQTSRAVALAEAAHEAAPADAGITAALARAYVQAGQPDRATGLLDRASAGNNTRLDFMRAGILAQQGKAAQAKATLQTILDKNPGDINARLLIGGINIKAGDFAAARAILRDGLKQTPGNPALLDALAGIDLRQAGSPQAGLKAALATAAALRAVPANLPAANSLSGDLYLAAGDARAAAAAYLAAYKLAPSAELAIKAAGAASRAGNKAQGIALLSSWTSAHQADIAPLLVLSSMDLESGRLAQAAQSLQAVIAADATNAAALNNLAWIRQHQGNTTEAKTLAERAYFQSPGAETADTLGWILAQQNDKATALPLLKQAAASTAPSLHAAATYHYAVALAAAGQREAARAQLEPILSTPTPFRDREEAAHFLTTLK